MVQLGMCRVSVYVYSACVGIMSCGRLFLLFFFLMIRRPPRSTLDRSSAASDVYKRQAYNCKNAAGIARQADIGQHGLPARQQIRGKVLGAVSYTHLRAHETVLDLVCRLLLEKTKNTHTYYQYNT